MTSEIFNRHSLKNHHITGLFLLVIATYIRPIKILGRVHFIYSHIYPALSNAVVTVRPKTSIGKLNHFIEIE